MLCLVVIIGIFAINWKVVFIELICKWVINSDTVSIKDLLCYSSKKCICSA